ncbi:MAG TPA: hypothetical protein VHN39_16800, partial [Phenylobacterium sp.]|nr:hypothetical protein [Phenylobacterium sp.]
FQKVSRVVRLTVALDFKLGRDAAREARVEAREAEAAEAETARQGRLEAACAPPGPIAARKSRVSNLLNRLLWNECEGDSEEYEVLSDDLSARLDEAARSADFETLPVEVLTRRVISDMGLSGDFALSVCETGAGAAPASDRPPPSADTG